MTKQEAERKVKELGLGLDDLRECAIIFGEPTKSVAAGAVKRGVPIDAVGALRGAYRLLEKWCK